MWKWKKKKLFISISSWREAFYECSHGGVRRWWENAPSVTAVVERGEGLLVVVEFIIICDGLERLLSRELVNFVGIKRTNWAIILKKYNVNWCKEAASYNEFN